MALQRRAGVGNAVASHPFRVRKEEKKKAFLSDPGPVTRKRQKIRTS